MSVLPAGQPLARFLPDLEDLLNDPASYLGAAPVVIGPRRMYGLAALFAVPGAAFLASCAWGGKGVEERLALGIGLLIGAMVWFGWSLMLRGHELVLHRDGVAVKYRGTTVWCPWALFNADGSPFVPDADSPRAGLTLPVAPEALPFVELRRDDTPVAHGAEVKARQLLFIASNEVVLPARYEVAADDLGELLLQLGRRLGRSLPTGTPPPEAYRVQYLDEPVPAPDPAGWITAYLTRLRFPPRCCDCCEPTTATLRFHVEPRGEWFLGQLTNTSRSLELLIPVCPACQARIRERQHEAGHRGLSTGAALLLGASLLVAWGEGVHDLNVLFLLALLGLAVGGIAGFLIGTTLGRRLPVQLRGYSPSTGKVSLRFRNPDYVSLVHRAMRDPAKGAAPWVDEE
jgi:hypothetical protein